ncbi:MAG: hypothetical protein AAF423_14310, partial [Pseudomonadota bacterium]
WSFYAAFMEQNAPCSHASQEENPTFRSLKLVSLRLFQEYFSIFSFLIWFGFHSMMKRAAFFFVSAARSSGMRTWGCTSSVLHV